MRVAPTRHDAELMREAAGSLLDSLDTRQRRAATFAMDDEGARADWDYRPRSEPGVTLRDLDEHQRGNVHELIAAATAAAGHARIVQIIGLELVLARMEPGNPARDPMRYAFSIFGDPRDVGWGWRFEGHHVSLNLTIAGDSVSASPSFLGANPAGHRDSAGRRVRPLAREEDLARTLVNALDPGSLAQAVISEQAPPDVVTSNEPYVGALAPAGVPVADVGPEARELLGRLLETWAVRLPDGVARQELDRLDGADGRGLHFAWAGGLEPGLGHYYRVSGPRLLLEYQNTRNGANHVHSVWRDPAGDFGRDLLREHLARHHAEPAGPQMRVSRSSGKGG
jgi:Protein of unknown function (DUF3500)